jgi:hypothetical protein
MANKSEPADTGKKRRSFVGRMFFRLKVLILLLLVIAGASWYFWDDLPANVKWPLIALKDQLFGAADPDPADAETLDEVTAAIRAEIENNNSSRHKFDIWENNLVYRLDNDPLEKCSRTSCGESRRWTEPQCWKCGEPYTIPSVMDFPRQLGRALELVLRRNPEVLEQKDRNLVLESIKEQLALINAADQIDAELYESLAEIQTRGYAAIHSAVARYAKSRNLTLTRDTSQALAYAGMSAHIEVTTEPRGADIYFVNADKFENYKGTKPERLGTPLGNTVSQPLETSFDPSPAEGYFVAVWSGNRRKTSEHTTLTKTRDSRSDKNTKVIDLRAMSSPSPSTDQATSKSRPWWKIW